MHSLRGRTWLLLASAVTVVRTAVVPPPVITPAPARDVEEWRKRQDLNPVDLAQLLLTAMPMSLRQIAATNVAAVSSILWNEFLDDRKPQWFRDLPWEIQSYLIREFGPETAWLTSSPTSASVETTASTTDSSAETSGISTSTSQSVSSDVSSLPTPSSIIPSSTSALESPSASAPAPSSTSGLASSSSSEPDAPTANSDGLTRTQKIGLGVGIPLGILSAAFILFSFCFVFRRNRKGSRVNGSERASSPGFIPHFAFQDTSTDHHEHRVPLNPSANQRGSWDDEFSIPASMDYTHQAQTYPSPTAQGMTMQDSTPIMAPVLFHTHSSNRARGKRTSNASLHSVAEMREPGSQLESPILGRHNWPKQSLRRSSIPEHSDPFLQPQPPMPSASVPRRTSLSADPSSPAARPNLALYDHSTSTLSGFATSTPSRHASDSAPASPISPVVPSAQNPFSNSAAYVEDFGPEYANGYGNGHGNGHSAYAPNGYASNGYGNGHSGYSDHSYAPPPAGYIDVEDGLYGGHRSLDAYTYTDAPSPPRRNARAEWPLRNVMGGTRRKGSPMWDRVYDE